MPCENTVTKLDPLQTCSDLDLCWMCACCGLLWLLSRAVFDFGDSLTSLPFPAAGHF